MMDYSRSRKRGIDRGGEGVVMGASWVRGETAGRGVDYSRGRLLEGAMRSGSGIFSVSAWWWANWPAAGREFDVASA